MNYSIKAIETIYEGVRFRSRLEAKWAAMFDLLSWRWDYEPVDFDGWIPDFAIYGETTVYVEVKPVDEFPREIADEMEASGCRDEMLIVGARGPQPQKGWNGSLSDDGPYVGWLCDKQSREWSHAIMGRWKDGGGAMGFCHESQVFNDRISGGYDGGCYGSGYVSVGEITRLWREAGNKTQWRRG